MGKIYYVIPDLHKKSFHFRSFIKSVLKGDVIHYFKNNVFRKHKPVGGIKVMYQHCMLLREMGYDASPLLMGEYVGNFFGYNINSKHINDVGYELNKGDVIVSPELFPYLGLKFAGCTRVLFNQSQSWRYYHQRLIEDDIGLNYLQLGYDHVINCSEHLCKMLKMKMNVDSIPITNGVDANIFSQDAARRVSGRVLALSRKHPEQIKKIIKATKHLNFEFRVVDGLSESELIKEFQSADIFLATGYPEGLPLPPLEAMNCGCVVVGFSGGGGDEYMLNNMTALVAKDGDWEGVVKKLKMIEKDDDLREKLRANGINKASTYTLGRTKEMLRKFYDNIL